MLLLLTCALLTRHPCDCTHASVCSPTVSSEAVPSRISVRQDAIFPDHMMLGAYPALLYQTSVVPARVYMLGHSH